MTHTMAQITITLTDTPTGGVSVHSSFKPAIGSACTAAQAAALDTISRTRRDYGLPESKPISTARSACGCDNTPTLQELETDRCMGCGGGLLT